ERDQVVCCRSVFRSTGLSVGPEYVRYEIHAVVDGVPMVFSDDPAVANLPAQSGAPLRALFQGAQLDLTSAQVLEVGPWRPAARSTAAETGIASDGLNGYRFMLLVDRSVAQTVLVDKVVVVWLQ
ncbi:MAG: hypothetical protein ABIP94_04825, partial [Planctomycetota bacterium]